MELACDGDELSWTTILFHDPPEALSTNSVKSLGQINVGRVQVSVLLLALFLELPSCKYHVNGPAILAESTLALW